MSETTIYIDGSHKNSASDNSQVKKSLAVSQCYMRETAIYSHTYVRVAHLTNQIEIARDFFIPSLFFSLIWIQKVKIIPNDVFLVFS